MPPAVRKRATYPLVKAILRLALSFAYPKEGWSIQNKQSSRQSVYFEMTSCLYCEELKKRGTLELCSAFCQTDHASYDPLAPSVVFTRKATLAMGGEVCDFCFSNGRLAIAITKERANDIEKGNEFLKVSLYILWHRA